MAADAAGALAAAGRLDDDAIDLAQTALALAQFDRPQLDLAPYRAHLAQLASDLADVARASGPGVMDRVGALSTTLAIRHGYGGDAETYDDLANADLAGVIDRRRGLPVALAILWLHAGRAQGWRIHGLNLPGHFFLEVHGPDGRCVIDPFHGGGGVNMDELLGYLRRTLGPDAQLNPENVEGVSNRAILMRLRNNIRGRLLKAGKPAEALRILESMALISPRDADIHRVTAQANQELGNLQAALACMDRAIAVASTRTERQEMTALRQALRQKLN